MLAGFALAAATCSSLVDVFADRIRAAAVRVDIDLGILVGRVMARYLKAHAALFSEPVAEHGVRPRFRQSLGHKHVSQLLSVGTADTSVSREILDFIDS